MKKKYSEIIIDNIKTIIFALVIAIFIRSFIFQPFYIPSSSMEPTLLVGDRIFVSKYTYGYSNHSMPFSPKIIKDRIFNQDPERGDLVVFKTPADNRTDYIKRLIGLPGEVVQFIDGDIFIDNQKIKREKIINNKFVKCGRMSLEVNSFKETLPNGITYLAVYNKLGTLQNSQKFRVPKNHYFLLGDNRDCSKDSRYLDTVGYVNFVNLVGKARIIFFSNDTSKGSMLKFWSLNDSFRLDRTFNKIK